MHHLIIIILIVALKQKLKLNKKNVKSILISIAYRIKCIPHFWRKHCRKEVFKIARNHLCLCIYINGMKIPIIIIKPAECTSVFNNNSDTRRYLYRIESRTNKMREFA